MMRNKITLLNNALFKLLIKHEHRYKHKYKNIQ